MVEELSQRYSEALHRLKMIISDDLYDEDADVPIPDEQQFRAETSDGIPIRKLFVGNLAERTTYIDLLGVFSKYGKVDSCYLKRNANRNNYAFVTFNNSADAVKARWDGYRKEIRLHNRDLRVSSADPWHQPDSSECQNKLFQLRCKTPQSDESGTCEQEEDIDDEEEDQSLINRLNDDCLIHIFQFLPILDRVRIERVCKRWRTLSLNSWHGCRQLNMSSVSQEFFMPIKTRSLRNVLLRCGQFVTDISGKTVDMRQSTLTIITKLCPNIQKIDITEVTVTPAGIAALTNTYSGLIELKLGPCTYGCDSDLKKLFQNNPNLRKVHIENNQINGTCLTSLPATLQELTLRNCGDILASHFCDAINRLSDLKRLSVIHCIGMYDCTLEQLSKCPQISSLDLTGGFPLLNQNGMANIARMVNLKELNLKECTILVTDSVLAEISRCCLNLTTVDVTSCDKLTGEGISKLFSLPNLQHLSMANLLVTEFEINKNNVPLKLRTLNLDTNFKLSERSVCEVVENAPYLELLVLNSCINMTNNLLEVATRCTKSRTTGVLLKLEGRDTEIWVSEDTEISPLLHVVSLTFPWGKMKVHCYNMPHDARNYYR